MRQIFSTTAVSVSGLAQKFNVATKRRSCLKVYGALLTLGCAAQTVPTIAQQSTTELTPLTVTGYIQPPKTQLSESPLANPASTTLLDYSDEDKRDVRTYGDLLRPVTGINVVQFDHGGTPCGARGDVPTQANLCRWLSVSASRA